MKILYIISIIIVATFLTTGYYIDSIPKKTYEVTYVLYYPNHNDTLISLTQEIETLKPIIKVQTNDGTNYITLEWNDEYYRVSSITPMKIINIKEK